MLKHRGGTLSEEQQDRIVIPDQENIRQKVFYWSHAHISVGHFGRNATMLRASLKFFWPGMCAYLKHRIEQCNRCLAKIQTVNLKQTEHRPHKHGYPGEVLYVDLVGAFEENEN